VLFAFSIRILLAFYSLQYRENTDILRNKDWAKISFLYGYTDTYTTKHIIFGTMPNNMPPGLLYILSAFYVFNIQLAKIILRIQPHTTELFALLSGPMLNMVFRFPAIIADCLIGIGVWLYFSKKEYIRNRTLVTLLILFNPFYWEDIDLSYRARKTGWKTLFESKSIVHHYHEEGKIKSVYTTTDVKRIVYRNQFIFIWKNLTDKKQLFFHALYTPVRIIQAMLVGDYLMLQGCCLAIQKIKAILTCRYLQRRSYSKTDRDLDLWV
jgi:hypothetical protein